MRIAHFDPVGGAAGDMILAALLDAGLSPRALRAQIARIGLKGVRLSIRKESRHHLQVTRVDVILPKSPPPKPTRLGEVLSIIEASRLSPEIQKEARKVFQALADAEGKVHGTTAGRVHLHEAGARDAMVDVVGAVAGMRILGIDRVTCLPLPLGSGHIEAAHGPLPLPGPATVELLRGHEVRMTGEAGEKTTPTGAAILTTLCSGFGPPPPFRIESVGYGAGTRRDRGVPNVLRVFIGEAAGPPAEEVIILETVIDDMNPEHYGHVFTLLHEAGALEVTATPTVAKKNRPGTILRVLSSPGDSRILEEIVLKETTTFGLRRIRAERNCLDRDQVKVRTRFGTIRVKIGRMGKEIVARSPEYEDCRKAARKADVPIQAVYDEAIRRARDRRDPAG